MEDFKGTPPFGERRSKIPMIVGIVVAIIVITAVYLMKT